MQAVELVVTWDLAFLRAELLLGLARELWHYILRMAVQGGGIQPTLFLTLGHFLLVVEVEPLVGLGELVEQGGL
ncbi:hypothetical protein ACZ75_10385 [Massilia sp. NR 4-1]|nr:hypothetical protein ACZ75_10385 [Massilia sp. NR 4-1]